MAVTLTASNSLAIQKRVREKWNEEGSQAGRQYFAENTTAKALLSNNSLGMEEVWQNGRCVGVKLWMVDVSDGANAVDNVGTTPPTTDCDLVATKEVGTRGFTYTPNLYLQDGFTVSDALCGNDAQFTELVSAGLAQRLRDHRAQLNTNTINFLNDNASANLDTRFVGSEFTVDGVKTLIPENYWLREDFLMKLAIMATNNKMGQDFLIVDGSNLLLNQMMAPYYGQNDNQRSFGAAYRDMLNRYYSDMLRLDTVVGESTTFLVNPNMFGFMNMAQYGLAPTVIDPSRNRSAFSIPDPELTYRRVRRDPNTGRTSVETVPVMYDVYYEYACSGRDARGTMTYDHKWEVDFRGAMFLGPTSQSGFSANTNGILKLVREIGI